MSPLLEHGVMTVSYWVRRYTTATGTNFYDIQYSTNKVGWTTVASLSDTNLNWVAITNSTGFQLEPGYLRIIKAGDNGLNCHLGLDDIVLTESPGVILTGLTNAPATPMMDETVDIYIRTQIRPGMSNVVINAMYRFSIEEPFSAIPMICVTDDLYMTSTPIPAGAGIDGSVQYYVDVTCQGYGPTNIAMPEAGSSAPASYWPQGIFAVRDRQLMAASRRTGIIISEIMYNPAKRTDGKNMEYIELFNSEPVDQYIANYRISGDVEYRFPSNAVLKAGAFIVLAADPSALRSEYLLGTVYGPLTNGVAGASNLLPDDSGTIRLKTDVDALLIEVDYSDDAPWFAGWRTDGTGHSLVLARPDYGQDVPEAWSSSAFSGGSPGRMDPADSNALRNVVINEFLAHTDPPFEDYVELYNHSPAPVDISGCWLSDQPGTNKFTIPGGTILGPGGFVSFGEAQLGFSLLAGGEAVYLRNPAGNVVLDAVSFAAQQNGVTSGRYPDGSEGICELASRTPGTTNSAPLCRDVVINEIMYHPISGWEADEYVELHNRGTNDIDISNWRFVAGIDYAFPAGTIIPAGGFVVVAKDLTNLVAKCPQLNNTNSLGNFGGVLANGGERVALAKPDNSSLPWQDFVVVDEVTYSDGWGEWTDGGGSSLELTDSRSDNRLGANWAGSDESQKAPWTTIDYTDSIDNGLGTINEMNIYAVNAGECMIDDIVMTTAAVTNFADNFEGGTNGWFFRGSHVRSSLEPGAGVSGTTGLHIRASERGEPSGPYDSQYGIKDNNAAANAMAITPSAGQVMRIRAKARWICGFPYLVVGSKCYWIETEGGLVVPGNLGTPGQQNSRSVANAGPAIEAVAPSPILPTNAEPVVISCRVSDPDGVSSVNLRYRIDPAYVTNTVVMRDNGTGGDVIAGDGVYGGTIPGYPASTLAAFVVEADDGAGGHSRYPAGAIAGAPPLECLVCWGIAKPSGVGIPEHRAWISAINSTLLANRGGFSKEMVDCTYSYEDYRVIYNARFRNRGGYYVSGYVFRFPAKDGIFGDNKLGVRWHGGGGSLPAVSRYGYWLCSQLGEPAGVMRPVVFRVNNGARSLLYDNLPPSADVCESWFGDPDPEVFKNQDWTGDPLGFYTNAFGEMKRSLYAGRAVKRGVLHPNNDYSQLFKLAAAVNTADNAKYVKRVKAVVDVRNWASFFALMGLFDDWDKYGYAIAHNYYVYSPRHAGSCLMFYDLDAFFSASGVRFPTGHPVPNRMFAGTPEFTRMYWSVLKDAADGPLLPERTDPYLDNWYSTYLTNGFDPGSPSGAKAAVVAARTSVYAGLVPLETFLMIGSGGGASFHTNGNPVLLVGSAPVYAEEIRINGRPYSVEYPTLTTWQLRVWLEPGPNVLHFTAHGHNGNVLENGTAGITITYDGTDVSRAGKLVINEIMYNPRVPYASYVELMNISTNTLELGGLRIDGIDCDIGYGNMIAPGGYAVIAGNISGYQAAYSNAEVVAGEFRGTLDNGGETLKLLMPTGTDTWEVIDEVKYDDDSPWPREADGGGCSLQLRDPRNYNNRPGNWAADPVAGYTPGWTNSVYTSLPPFELIYINEVQSSNVTGAVDEQGDHEPWIELFNGGSNSLDLGAGQYYLSDDYTNLLKWPFPAGIILGTGAYTVVWADGESGEGPLHTSFRLNSQSGTVALAKEYLGTALLVDHMSYQNIGQDRSYGIYPEGTGRTYQVFHYPTCGTLNNPASEPVAVTINEWMARNSSVIADPADGDFDDWFELYNVGAGPVDLGGFGLSDNLAATNRYIIPGGRLIGPGGFMLVWADGETGQNAPGRDLHADFQLSGDGDAIALYAPDGSLIDSVVFGSQIKDVGEGLYPDGSGLLYQMPISTPGQTNVLLKVYRMCRETNGTMRLEWNTRAGRQYLVLYSDSLKSTNWQAVGADAPAGSTTMLTNITFTGATQRFFRVRQMN